MEVNGSAKQTVSVHDLKQGKSYRCVVLYNDNIEDLEIVALATNDKKSLCYVLHDGKEMIKLYPEFVRRMAEMDFESLRIYQRDRDSSRLAKASICQYYITDDDLRDGEEKEAIIFDFVEENCN